MITYMTAEFGGKTRGLKVGVGFMQRVLEHEKPEDNNILAVNTIKLIYHSLAFNCEMKGEKVDFTIYNLYDWIDEKGLNHDDIIDFQIMFYKSMTTHLPEEGNEAIEKVVEVLEEGKKKKVTKKKKPVTK